MLYFKDNVIKDNNQIVIKTSDSVIYNPDHQTLLDNGWTQYDGSNYNATKVFENRGFVITTPIEFSIIDKSDYKDSIVLINEGTNGLIWSNGVYYSGGKIDAQKTEIEYLDGSIDMKGGNIDLGGGSLKLGDLIIIDASGNVNIASDERLKNFTERIPINLDRLSELKKNYFTWKDSENKEQQLGISAQEIRELYPEIVSEQENGTLTVAYDKLSVIALAAIDELHKKNKELEERLTILENKLK